MIDLARIPPLTEEEAELIYNQPSARERYDEALVALDCLDEYQTQHIRRYVALLRKRLAEARAQAYAVEMLARDPRYGNY